MDVIKKTRKFKELTEFDSKNEDNIYYFLPFRFHRISDEKEIIVNEVGDFLILPNGTYERIVKRKINKSLDQELYGDLISNFFISEQKIYLQHCDLRNRKFNYEWFLF